MKFIRNDPALRERRRELRRNLTEAEKTFWRHVRNRQLYGMRFFRQYSVGPYVLDFYCPSAQLAVELDGGQHSESKEYDEARSEYLKAHGIDIVRFWNHEVLHDMHSVLAKLSLKVTPPRLPLPKGEGKNKVLAAEYRTALPDEKTLAAEIDKTRRMLEGRGIVRPQKGKRK